MGIPFEFVLLDAGYEIQIQDGVEKPLLRLWGRYNSKRVEVRVIGYLPYFYAEAGEEIIKRIFVGGSDHIKNWLLQATHCEKCIYFGGFPRIVTKLIGNVPYRVPEVRNLIQNLLEFGGEVIPEVIEPKTKWK